MQKPPSLSKSLISVAVTSALLSMISSAAVAEETTTLDTLEITATSEEGVNAEDSTATKMNISLKDTARSVTKVSEEEISDMAAQDIQDVAAYQTGFKWEEAGTRYIYNRGMQTNLDSFTVNGLKTLSGSRAINSSSLPTTYNLESVSFLNGADGILYGSGIAGGVINATTKTPQEEAETTLGISTRSYAADDVGYLDRNTFTFDIDSTGKLDKNGDVLYRVITQVTPDGESYQDEHGTDDKFIDASLTFKVGDKTKITPRFEYKDQTDPGGVNWTVGQFTSNFFNGSLDSTTGDLGSISDRSLFYGSPLDESTSKSTTAEVHIEHLLNDNWSLNARAALVETERQSQALYVSNSTGLGNSIGDDTFERKWVYGEAYHTFKVLDANTEGRFTTGDVNHHLITGVNYRERTTKADTNYQSNGDAIGLYTINAYDPDDQLYSDIPDSVKDLDLNETLERDINIYLKERASIGKWTLGLGLGYLMHHGEETNGTYQKDQQHLAYDGAAIYKLNQNLNLFAAYSQSYDPVDTSDIVNYGEDGVDYVPEESDNYEIGIKGDFFNRKLNASANLFYINKKNETYTEGDDDDETLYQNLGEKFRSHGLEISALYHFTNQFSTQVNYTYTDAHETEGSDAGKQSDMTPFNSLTVWNSYSLESQPIRFALGMRSESSKIFKSVNNSSSLSNYDLYVPGYAEFDAGVYYETEKWDASLTVKNLLDKNRVLTTANWFAVQASDPRSINFSLKYRL